MSHSSPFRYEIPKTKAGDKLEPSNPCTFKLWFGKKYLIWKGKALHQALDNIAIQLDRGIRVGVSEKSAFIKVVDYIKKGRITFFTVEIMLQSSKPPALLRSELLLLRKAKKDADCLNMVFEPYIPQWIPAKDVKEYETWKSNLNKKKKNEPAKNHKVLSSRKSVGTIKKSVKKRNTNKV